MKTFLLQYFLADGNVINIVTSSAGRKSARIQAEPLFLEVVEIYCVRRKITRIG